MATGHAQGVGSQAVRPLQLTNVTPAPAAPANRPNVPQSDSGNTDLTLSSQSTGIVSTRDHFSVHAAIRDPLNNVIDSSRHFLGLLRQRGVTFLRGTELDGWETYEQDQIKAKLTSDNPANYERIRDVTLAARRVRGAKTLVLSSSDGEVVRHLDKTFEGSNTWALAKNHYGFEEFKIRGNGHASSASAFNWSNTVTGTFNAGTINFNAKDSVWDEDEYELRAAIHLDFNSLSHTMLGALLEVSGWKAKANLDDPSADSTCLMTIGGIVMVGGKMYGLTMGHGVSRLRRALEDNEPQKSRSGAPLFAFEGPWTRSRTIYGRVSTVRYLSDSKSREGKQSSVADWALVELDEAVIIPPNRIFAPKLEDPKKTLRADELWVLEATQLWEGLDQGGTASANVVYQVMSRAQISTDLFSRTEGLAFCLVATTRGVKGGFIATGTAAMVIEGETFRVWRVYMQDPLEAGDSGAWVTINNRVCGAILGYWTGDETDVDGPILSGGYMLPLQDILDDISQAMLSEARLPTATDWKVATLRSHVLSQSWSGRTSSQPVWAERVSEIELLLSTQFKEAREREQNETGRREKIPQLRIDTAPGIPHLQFRRRERFALNTVGNLHHDTIESALLLGEICPVSDSFRWTLSNWLSEYRRSRLHGRLTLAAAAILQQYTASKLGENVLALMLFLWMTLGQDELQVAFFLSGIFEALGDHIPSTLIPNLEQLTLYVKCVASAFKAERINQLYLPELRAPKLLKPDIPGPVRSFAQVVNHVIAENRRRRISPMPDLVNQKIRNNENQPWISMRQYTSRDRTKSGAWLALRLLVLMQHIVKGDKTQVLVVGGRMAAWAALYAMMLGLVVEDRHSPGVTPTRQVDVIIYPYEIQPYLCEILDRSKIRWFHGKTTVDPYAEMTGSPPVPGGTTPRRRLLRAPKKREETLHPI